MKLFVGSMRKLLLVLTLMVAGQLMVTAPVLARSESIAVVVNEDAITMSDVKDRVTLIIRSSGMPDNENMRNQIRPSVIDALIEEQIKLQEAERLEVEVTQEQIEAGFAQLAQQNNAEADQFREMLTRAGININTMYRQIKSQIAWGGVIQASIRPKIVVTDADVEDALSRLRDNIGKTEYHVAEIFLAIDNPKEANDIRALANKLSRDMQDGKVPFFRVAQQFSKSAGAAKGGDLGWIQQGQLDQDLENAITGLDVNGISAPVKGMSGYHIFLLRDKREIIEETMPSVEGMTSTIGTQRLERLQRRHLQDLKAQAFIDTRV
ncbi:MAG: rotamase [Micavibrio sp.]|nr:rotamase [Micavibrio sp.]|tara:strand:- start:1157 stop:2122 length:966 start_codon:yes stop_codon:yes gene_type:complete